jgi:hypothetical protein
VRLIAIEGQRLVVHGQNAALHVEFHPDEAGVDRHILAKYSFIAVFSRVASSPTMHHHRSPSISMIGLNEAFHHRGRRHGAGKFAAVAPARGQIVLTNWPRRHRPAPRCRTGLIPGRPEFRGAETGCGQKTLVHIKDQAVHIELDHRLKRFEFDFCALRTPASWLSVMSCANLMMRTKLPCGSRMGL